LQLPANHEEQLLKSCSEVAVLLSEKAAKEQLLTSSKGTAVYGAARNSYFI
jgi:hypothetical protein